MSNNSTTTTDHNSSLVVKMLNYIKLFNKFIEKSLVVFVLLATIAGYILGEKITYARDWVLPMFAYMTFVSSLKCSFKEIITIIQKPKQIFMILIVLHFIVPFAVYLVKILMGKVNSEVYAGFLLIVALPAGVTAGIWTAITNGNVSLALVTITIDTMLSPIFTPLTISLLLGQELKDLNIDFSGMQMTLLKMLVLPAILGIAIHDNVSVQTLQNIIPFLTPLSMCMLICVIALNVASVSNTINEINISLLLWFFGTMLLVLYNFLLGYYIPKIAIFDMKDQISSLFTIGIRNVSAGLVIALKYFPPVSSIPVVISVLLQQPIAAILSRKITSVQNNKDNISL